MIVLGIESTAHTLGIGVVRREKRKKEIIASAFDRFPSSAQGFIPRKLADHHAKVFPKVLDKALVQSGISLKEVNAVAYSQGPGIGHCLRAGFIAATSLSTFLRIPLIPVNHAVAHIEIGKFVCSAKNPLVLYISGGNTQLVSLEESYYRVFGETLDIGIGNFLDVVGRTLCLTPPDAVGVMQEAREGKQLIELPYTVKGMNFFFSGLLTSVEKLWRKKAFKARDLCFSVQETAFSMLIEAAERCLCQTRSKELLVVGGVAQNNRLKEMLELMCREQKVRLCVTPPEYTADNGAMIALNGLLMLECRRSFGETRPDQRLRIDSHAIFW